MANRWLRESMRLAENAAVKMKQGELTTAHVFFGLVQQDGPVHKVVVRNMNVSMRRIFDAVHMVSATSIGVLPGGSVAYTRAVNEALSLAEGRAGDLGHPDGAMREDVLVALLLQQDDYFIDTLRILNLDRYRLLQVFAPEMIESEA